jgi:hypothetical protein
MDPDSVNPDPKHWKIPVLYAQEDSVPDADFLSTTTWESSGTCTNTGFRICTNS